MMTIDMTGAFYADNICGVTMNGKKLDDILTAALGLAPYNNENGMQDKRACVRMTICIEKLEAEKVEGEL